MKTMVTFSLLCLLAASAASAAYANPSPGGDCVAASQADLGGTLLATTHEQDAQTVSGDLLVAPASFFVAEGYGVKVFTAPIFGGEGLYIGGVEDLAHAQSHHLKPAVGGHYVNTADLGLSGPVRSFACVAIGQAFPASGTLADGTAYFNDTAFGLTGYRGNHTPSTSVSVTFQNGKKLLSTNVTTYNGSFSRFVLDLDSEAIVASEGRIGSPGDKSVTYHKGQAGYADALEQVRGTLAAVTTKNAGERRPDKQAPIANLELLPLLNKLRHL